VDDRQPSKRKAQAAATQEQLLQAAREVFAERGYQATTVGSITKAANTAHGTFYLYFRNKEDAFAKVLESVVLDIYDATWSVPADGDVRGVLEETLRRFLGVYVRHAGIWRCLLEGAFSNPAIEAAWGELRGGFITRTARTLGDLHEAGAIRDVDVDLTANALGAMVEWTATTQFVLRVAPAADFESTLATLTDLWFHALYVDVSSPA
jgi:AcrR family transcriptional regulator